MNVGTADNTAGLLYVNEPVEFTKLVDGVIVPLLKEKVPLFVNVVQEIVPVLVSVPAVNDAVLEQVKLNVAKSMVPLVCVYVVHVNALANATVLDTVALVNAAIVLPLDVIVFVPEPAGAPVPTSRQLTANDVYVPPLANIKFDTFTVPAAGIQVLPVKSNVLK